MDGINASFELLGAAFIAPSIWRAMRLKKVEGVHWLTPAFFWSWGLWNVFYYPHLGQTWSFLAGLLLMVANTLWLYAVLRYTPRVD